MMNTTINSLHQCLEEEVKAMASLAELLEKEQAALVDGKVEDLSKVTVNKVRVITDISELEKIRARQLTNLGFKADKTGMQAWLKQVPVESDTGRCWAKLLEITSKANESNRTNGILINKHMNYTQGALKILQQNDPVATTGSLYGPSGHTTIGTSSGRGFAAR